MGAPARHNGVLGYVNSLTRLQWYLTYAGQHANIVPSVGRIICDRCRLLSKPEES